MSDIMYIKLALSSGSITEQEAEALLKAIEFSEINNGT